MFSHIFPIKCLHLKSTCSLMCINFPPEYKLHVLQGRGKTEIDRTSVVVTTDSKQWYAQYLRKESMLEKGKHRCSLITLLKIFFSEKKNVFYVCISFDKCVCYHCDMDNRWRLLLNWVCFICYLSV